jgi:5,6,7,8-tetrahydromethanopterin hydro-lyase
VLVGEGFAGDGVNAAHINTIAGPKDGPVATAWATALATPRAGHIPFVAVLAPNVPVKPMTLFVNKATVDAADDRHARLTWGAAQAGVAAGVQDALRREEVNPDELLIAAVWVNPAADDEELVFANNRNAMIAALAAGREGRPTIEAVLDVAEPQNPYFRA